MDFRSSDLLALLQRIVGLPPSLLTSTDYADVQAALERVRSTGRTSQDYTEWPPADAWRFVGDSSVHPRIRLMFAQRLASLISEPASRNGGHLPADRLSLVRARLGQRLLRSPLHSPYLRFTRMLPSWVVPQRREYNAFRRLAELHAPDSAQRAQSRASWKRHPKISLLLTTHGTRESWFREAIQSVRSQCYEHWELCICDDASGQDWIGRLLSELQAIEPRVRMKSSPDRLGVSGALNVAAGMASGEYVTFLDHDDVLDEAALHYVVQAMQQESPDLVYTDEDFIDRAGRPERPHFKPDWSPHLLNGCMYLGHLMVLRRSLFEKLGGFRPAFDGAQDYDLALRAAECSPRVVHVPHVAYHWRMHNESVAQSAGNKPYTHSLGRHAVEQALERRGSRDVAVVTNHVPNLFHLRPRLESPGYPSVHVLRFATGRQGAEQVLFAGKRSSATFRECLIADTTGVGLPATLNEVGLVAESKFLLFLDVRLRAPVAECVQLLAAALERPGVGIVGAKIQRADGRILHAGYALGGGEGVTPLGFGKLASAEWPWLAVSREVSAVSGSALCIRRADFQALGGFDTSMRPPYHAVDLCLRAAAKGLITALETGAVFTLPAAEPLERQADWSAWLHFMRRWGEKLSAPDGYYSPNLTLR